MIFTSINRKKNNKLGLAYHALKNYSLAISSFNKAIMLDDTYYESYIAKGFAIKQLKHENELSNAIKSVSLTLNKLTAK